jgi:hypothetical protein
LIAYEQRAGGRYSIWVTNEYGKEPLGSLCRDTNGLWFYEPLAGTYLYLGALVDIANKLYELSLVPEKTAAAAPAQAAEQTRRKFAVVEGDVQDARD